MIRIYRVPNKNYPIGEGKNLKEAVKDAFQNGEIVVTGVVQPRGREYTENEILEALENHITSARTDFIIVGSEE